MRPTRRYGLQESEKQMNIQEINDYAMPCMMAEKAVKLAYNLAINGDIQAAIEECEKAKIEITRIIEVLKK